MAAFNPNAEPDNKEFERELIPEGPHKARCVRVIEIGDQYSDLYDVTKTKAIIVFSLPEVLMNFGDLGEKQAFISHPWGINLTNDSRGDMSMYRAALDPKKETTDLGGFLDRTCQISVKHKEREGKSTIAKIDSVAPLLSGIEVGEADTELLWLKWDDPDPEIYKILNDMTKDQIQNAVNYEGSVMQRMVEQLDQEPPQQDDVPF